MPEPQIKISAALPWRLTGRNSSSVGRSTTVISWLSQSRLVATPCVRTEFANHESETTAQRRKPHRIHQRIERPLEFFGGAAMVMEILKLDFRRSPALT